MDIKDIRQETGLSQSQFSEKFQIPAGTLRNWEQGIRKPPEYVISMIKKILELETKKSHEKQ